MKHFPVKGILFLACPLLENGPARWGTAVFRSFLVLMLAALPAFAGHRYEIDVTADPAHDKVVGTVRLVYRNDCGNLLTEVPLRGISTIARVFDKDHKELPLTGSTVRLRTPLQPRREAVLLFEFESPLPVGQNGYRLVTGAWHPKPQTFRKGAFNPQQEQADDYELRVVVPAGEVVALPGRLLQDKPLPNGKRSLRTVLENATSLGLAMSPQFTETVRKAAGVEIRCYGLERGPEWGAKLADLAADIVPFYRQFAGFYPHPSLVILPGALRSRGGYPAATGMVAIHNLEGTAKEFPAWIMAHEIGHQYWGFDTVIDDGDYCHWPGLAMGIWMDRQYMEARGLGRKRHDSFLVNNYLPALYAGRDTTLRRMWPEIRALDFDFNNAVAHGKAYTVIQMLEELMSAGRFRAFALTLLRDYRFRFISHEDFEKAAAGHQGEPLDWFFRDWLDADRKLGYEIAEVRHADRRAVLRIRQTGDAMLPLPVSVKTSDGRTHLLQLKRVPGEQSLSFDSESPPVFAAIDPDRRFPLYSPDAGYIWGKKVEVTDVRWPEMAWGTNQVRLVLQNTDDRVRRVTLNVQANTRSGGWGWDTEHRLEPGETKSLERDFLLKPFPGSYTVRVQVQDAEDGLIWKFAKTTGEFPAGNDRLAPLRIPDRLRDVAKAQREEYPRLRLLAGTNVFLYCLDGDAWLEQHASELLAERERYYQGIRARVNPSYEGKVTVLLFPDAESKQVWTGHTGTGWAVGQMLVEIRNAKESVDPAHELVHVIAGSLGEPPAVFSEGLAVYFQEGQRWDGYHVDAWCKAFASADMLWPVDRLGSLSDIGPTGTQPSVTYPQASSIVKFLIERVGFEKFLDGYRALGTGEAKASKEAGLAAFQKHFAMDPSTLEREWRASLEASDAPPVPEDVLQRIKDKLKADQD